MLTPQENDLLCRVEGDAPMGQLMRRHWIPALLSEQVPEPDGDPVPIRLFGENLVAWRDTDGVVGLMDRYCPHRKASLEFGRNEEGGLRCLYHGWKIDVKGQVVERPSEPPSGRAAQHVTAYPTHEHGGFIWAYMGPPDTMPPFQPPAFAPTADCKVSIAKMQIDCNWAQVLEGAIDSAHSSSLHSSDITPARVGQTRPTGNKFVRPSTDKAPRIEVQRTPYGFKYAALRRPIQNADKYDYLRMTVYIAPFLALIPPNTDYNICNLNVPIDDTHTMFHFIAWSPTQSGAPDQEEYRKTLVSQVGIDLDRHYRKKGNLENSYLQDRQSMKNGSFTGIKGFPNQDVAMWETMGPIADRSTESLGASDVAIVEFRRQMIEAIRQFQQGGPALGSVAGSSIPQAKIHSYEGMRLKGTEWRHLDVDVDAPAEPVAATAPSPTPEKVG